MSRVFRGINDLSALNAYSARKFYADTAVDPSFPSVRDLWFAETLVYGRMDEDQNVVLLKTSNLKQIGSDSGKNVFAVNFAADSFSDLRDFFKKAISIGQIRRTSKVLSDLNPQKAYVDPHEAYNKYVTEFYAGFVEYAKTIASSIVTFEDFLRELQNYISKSTSDVILTKSKFVGSNRCNVMNSGLAIELSTTDASKDQAKADDIFDDLTFEFFSNACVNFGWMIDKNVPWRIIADIGSPAMADYMNKYGITDQTLWEQDYDLAYFQEYEILKANILRFWNAFAIARPIFKKVLGANSQGVVKQQILTRTKETLTTIDEKFGEDLWLSFYVWLKNLETNRKYDDHQVVMISRQAKDLFQRDQGLVLEFINNKFVGFETWNGSLASRSQKA